MLSQFRRLACATALLSLVATSAVAEDKTDAASAASSSGEFSRSTIDLGVVVSDVDAAVKFYTEAVGFKKTGGFKVPGDFAKNSGLTSGIPLDITVLTLGPEETATRLKLMQVTGKQPKKGLNKTIHQQYGYSYITIFVKDTNAALARLKKAGVKPLAKGPVELPKGLPQGVYLTCVKDPDGNIVELVGPKK